MRPASRAGTGSAAAGCGGRPAEVLEPGVAAPRSRSRPGILEVRELERESTRPGEEGRRGLDEERGRGFARRPNLETGLPSRRQRSEREPRDVQVKERRKMRCSIRRKPQTFPAEGKSPPVSADASSHSDSVSGKAIVFFFTRRYSGRDPGKSGRGFPDRSGIFDESAALEARRSTPSRCGGRRTSEAPLPRGDRPPLLPPPSGRPPRSTPRRSRPACPGSPRSGRSLQAQMLDAREDALPGKPRSDRAEDRNRVGKARRIDGHGTRRLSRDAERVERRRDRDAHLLQHGKRGGVRLGGGPRKIRELHLAAANRDRPRERDGGGEIPGNRDLIDPDRAGLHFDRRARARPAHARRGQCFDVVSR